MTRRAIMGKYSTQGWCDADFQEQSFCNHSEDDDYPTTCPKMVYSPYTIAVCQ